MVSPQVPWLRTLGMPCLVPGAHGGHRPFPVAPSTFPFHVCLSVCTPLQFPVAWNLLTVRIITCASLYCARAFLVLKSPTSLYGRNELLLSQRGKGACQGPQAGLTTFPPTAAPHLSECSHSWLNFALQRHAPATGSGKPLRGGGNGRALGLQGEGS